MDWKGEPCPICGTEQTAEAVDVMVGYVQVEPYHCPNCYYCEDFDTGEEYREKIRKDLEKNEAAINEHNFLNYAYYYPPKGDENVCSNISRNSKRGKGRKISPMAGT